MHLASEREDPEQEEQRRRQAHKRQKMQPYIRSRRKTGTDSGGGYVTSEAMKEERERCLADLHTLSRLSLARPLSMPWAPSARCSAARRSERTSLLCCPLTSEVVI